MAPYIACVGLGFVAGAMVWPVVDKLLGRWEEWRR